MTFDEFLAATDEGLYSYYNSIEKGQHIEEIFHQKLLDAYNFYLIIGGMPECVQSWITHKDPAEISGRVFVIIPPVVPPSYWQPPPKGPRRVC